MNLHLIATFMNNIDSWVIYANYTRVDQEVNDFLNFPSFKTIPPPAQHNCDPTLKIVTSGLKGGRFIVKQVLLY